MWRPWHRTTRVLRYGDLAHGVKYLHLYVFAPCFSSPAGDYSDGDGSPCECITDDTITITSGYPIAAQCVPHHRAPRGCCARHAC